MLTESQISKLDRLKHYATRYEIEICQGAKPRLLVCYTPRKSLAGLINAAQDRWKHICAAIGATEEAKAHRIKKAMAYQFENGAIIRFSGRTQRDAIMSGELEFIGAD